MINLVNMIMYNNFSLVLKSSERLLRKSNLILLAASINLSWLLCFSCLREVEGMLMILVNVIIMGTVGIRHSYCLIEIQWKLKYFL